MSRPLEYLLFCVLNLALIGFPFEASPKGIPDAHGDLKQVTAALIRELSQKPFSSTGEIEVLASTYMGLVALEKRDSGPQQCRLPERSSQKTEPLGTIFVSMSNHEKRCGLFPLTNASIFTDRSFRAAAKEVNWSPCCLTKKMKEHLRSHAATKPFSGFSVGYVASPSFRQMLGRMIPGSRLLKGIKLSRKMAMRKTGSPSPKPSAGAAVEAAVMLGPDADTLVLRAYSVIEMGLGALPIPLPGGNLTQSLLHGCKSHADYEGRFADVSLLGMGNQFGVDIDSPVVTGCNSDYVATGSKNINPLQAGVSEYIPVTEEVTLRGPGVKDLIRIFHQAKSNPSQLEAELDKLEKKCVGESDDLLTHYRNTLQSSAERVLSRVAP